VRRGKRRLHNKPNRTEVVACRVRLESELTTIRPRVLVCLGVTSAISLISPTVRIGDQRGKVVATRWSPQTITTYHPSAILRARDEEAAAAKRNELVSDLRLARTLLAEAS
jgi:DNA polymerase